jgi:phosphatidylglycerophosphate synthase
MPEVSFAELKRFKHRINPEERQGAYGYYLIRPLSLYLTYLALCLGLSANQVTVLQTIAGLAGAFCLAVPSTGMGLAGLALLQFGFLLDNVDGEVARFRRQVSLTGKFLDSIGHQFVVPAMYFALGVSTYFRTGHFESVVFGFLAGLASLRLDIATLYQEAAQFIETRHDQTYDYYAPFKLTSRESLKLSRRKNEDSPIRLVYALFAYPATMNIITVLWLADWLFSPLVVMGQRFNLIYLFLVCYGTLLPLRRGYTVWRLVTGREAERKYLSLISRRKGT